MAYFYYLIYRMPDGTLRDLSGYTSDLDALRQDLEAHDCTIIDIDYES